MMITFYRMYIYASILQNEMCRRKLIILLILILSLTWAEPSRFGWDPSLQVHRILEIWPI